MRKVDIDYYLDYLSDPLLTALWENGEVAEDVPGLRITPVLRSPAVLAEEREAPRVTPRLFFSEPCAASSRVDW